MTPEEKLQAVHDEIEKQKTEGMPIYRAIKDGVHDVSDGKVQEALTVLTKILKEEKAINYVEQVLNGAKLKTKGLIKKEMSFSNDEVRYIMGLVVKTLNSLESISIDDDEIKEAARQVFEVLNNSNIKLNVK